ncbi:salicylate hydroxylase [Mollisia scopiformis]|uniref:Salicylate hydroxylase n=1 Tax=Mollisia scopiformis TaxID=149040 RepID=A0A132B4N9_MOLSC|nr:salicylate hydroxylase [Mollisia scopiformis]KUJ06637.1 salicylate hydroxylase [Mollisia scopiformis]
MLSTLTTTPLTITIVGGGIGGLSAATFLSQSGHKVTVLDSNPCLSEIGAGIQITPNAMRIFDRHGLKDRFYEEATKNEGATIRRWDNGTVLGKHRGMAIKRYGYFNLTLHRADYQRILYDAAIKAGAKVEFNRKVKDVDFSTPSLTLEDGQEFATDLVIAAEGIGSRTRISLFSDSHAHGTPDSAHRLILPSSILRSSPILNPLVSEPSSTIWFGPHRHIVAYTIRGTSLYNLVFCGPESSSSKIGVWNQPASLQDLKKEYEGWEEPIQEILNSAEAVHKWRIGEVPDLPSWRSENGKVVLLGDAAHAMMPYTAQGATSTVEDAAVLAGCLERVRSKEEISRLTEAYESIRKPRAEKVKKTSWGNMKHYGLVDGKEQEERDRMYAKTLVVQTRDDEERADKPQKDANAPYGSAEFSMWLYGYDVEEELEKYFKDGRVVD